jgi:serine/threonine protein kinase
VTPPEATPPTLPGLDFVRPLGRGGYAEVFLYEQQRPRMKVAVKVLYAVAAASSAADRFTAEANTMAELADHPYIVQVFRTDTTGDGRPYLVMKYYPQRNLAVRSSDERISVPEVLQIGVRISCAVETAHRAGILHRDIKPANILTSQYGEPGLTDFGIATTGADDAEEAEGLSLPWAPPEVVFASAPATTASDVYSLGATLWHLLTGHPPFERPGTDNSTLSVMRRIKEQPPPQTGRDDVPASLERVLAQAMAKRPEDRPQTALQLARALQAVETEERWSVTPLVLLGGSKGGDAISRRSTGDSGADTSTRPPTGPEVDDGHTAARPSVASGPGSGEDQATRRRPQLVHPEGTAPGTGRAPTLRSREGMPVAVPASETVRRPAVVGQPVDAATPEEGAEPTGVPLKSRRWIPGVLIGAVVVGVAIGISLLGHANHGSPSTSLPTVPGSKPTLVTGAGNQLSGAKAITDGGVVTFSWTQPQPLPSGSSLGWRRCNSDAIAKTIPGPPLTLPVEPNLCVEVDLKNSDGSSTSISISEPIGAAGA